METDFPQKHKVASWMFFVAVLLIGQISAFFLPISLYPNLVYPGLTIETEYFGVGPEKIEEIITKPIEESISTIGGIKQIFSTSEEGKSKIHIQFEAESNLDIRSLDIRDKLELATSNFPREVQKPVVLQYDPSQRPFFILTLKSDSLNLVDQREIADREIKKLFEGIPGISEVIVAGGSPREIQILCDPIKMNHLQIDFEDILRALQESNFNEAVGEIQESSKKYIITTRGRYQSLEKIRDTFVISKDQSTKNPRIRDLAEVKYSFREEDSASRLNGIESVSIYIYRAGTSNLIEISEKVKKAIKKIENKRIGFYINLDQGEVVKEVLSKCLLGTFFGMVFCIAIEYLLYKRLIFTMSVIILFVGSFSFISIVLFIFEYDFNLMTFLGLIQSFGIGILIVHLNRKFRIFQSTSLTSIEGEIILCILVITGVFLPLIFASKDYKNLYGGLALVLISSLLSSYLISKFILPLLEQKISFNRLNVSESSKLDPFLAKAEDFFFDLTEFLIKKPRWIFYSYLFFIFLGIYSFLKINQNHGNPIEEDQITGQVEFPSGTSFDHINEITKKIEQKLKPLKKVKEMSSRVENGQSTITIKLNESLKDSDSYFQALEKEIGDIRPVFVYFSGMNDEFSFKEITIDVIGDSNEELDSIIRDLANKAEEKISNVSNVLLRYKPPREELQLTIDRGKSELSGISINEIGRFIRYGIQGGVASKFFESSKEIDIKIQYDKKFRSKLKDLQSYVLNTKNGKQIPLIELVEFKKTTVPVKIFRKNKRRVLSFTIRFSQGNYSKFIEQLKSLKEVVLPENYRLEYSDQFESIMEKEKKITFLLVFSLLVLYMILASYSESLFLPFSLLSFFPVPISILFVNSYIFGVPLSIPIYVNLLLVGSIGILQTAIFRKRILEKYESFSNFKKKRNSYLLLEIPKFTLESLRIWLIVISFYLPFLFLFGVGSSFLKSVAFSFIFSGTIALVAVPFSFCLFHFFTDDLKQARLYRFFRKIISRMKSYVN